MLVKVRFNSWYISLSSSAKEQREMIKFCLSGEREPRQIIIKIYAVFQIFSFRVLAKINKLNDLRVSRDW